jgi:2-[(L-alanin-3-ylcarbamoyl)methyl]-2-hydroxybutanedioate decarboxylase
VPGAIPERVLAAVLATASPRCAYVYDRTILAETAAALRAALPADTTLLYAVKANGHPDVLAALSTEVDGFEVASGGELALARIARAGIGSATQIVFSGPGKTDVELAAAVEAEAMVNVESLLELRRLAVTAETTGTRVRTVLRVNRRFDPPVKLPGTLRMTGGPTPFGLDESLIGEAVDLAWGHPSVRVVGFSHHAVSNNLDAAAHAAFVRDAVAWSVRAAAVHRIPLEIVNVGGGFGIDYTNDERFDLSVLAPALDAVEVPAGVQLVFEIGRYLAADAGWYAAEVLDLKQTHGQWFAVLRGGTHHFRLPAAWGYSHPFTVVPVEEWARPYDRPEVRDVEVDAVGELCTPRDVLTRGQPVSRLRVGDVLIFARTGAYGWDISHHEFLRHDPPQFLVTGGSPSGGTGLTST